MTNRLPSYAMGSGHGRQPSNETNGAVIENTPHPTIDGAIAILEGAIAEHDPVNHPSHYMLGKYEVITVLEEWQRVGAIGGNEWNAIKYISRARFKGKQLEDLKKARFHINRSIAELEGQEHDS